MFGKIRDFPIVEDEKSVNLTPDEIYIISYCIDYAISENELPFDPDLRNKQLKLSEKFKKMMVK